MASREPTERDAAALVEHRLGSPVATLARFPTGLAHWVYDVETVDGSRVVARLGRHDQAADFAGAVHWHGRLAPRGVPLPRLLACDPAPSDGGFPFLLLERLPGIDLGDAYPGLTAGQKRDLARRVAAVQTRVGTLPPGPGFGFARSYADPDLHRTWDGVLQASLGRSRARIAAVGAVSPDHVDRVARRLPAHRDYLAEVTPTAFLDDATVKNVLVDRGRLSGIVDVDWVCFGDPLFAVALTRMALLARGYDTDYAEHWAAAMDLQDGRRPVLALYTALFCVDFLSELGQRFNQDAAPAVDPREAERLLAILDDLLAET